MFGSLEMSGPRDIDVLLVEDLSEQRLPARTLAAVLRQAGYRVRLVNYSPGRPDSVEGAGDVPSIVALAQRLQPRLVLFSVLFANWVAQYRSLVSDLKAAGVRSHLTMAGPLPSLMASELLVACPALDSVLCGEAEGCVAELMQVLDVPGRWQPDRADCQTGPGSVPGVTYRMPGGEIRRSSQPPGLLADLDCLPFPMRDPDLPFYRGYGFATIQGSRGCYHACHFCLPSAFYRAVARDSGGPRYRLRSVGNLVDEIEILYGQGIRLFLFDDEQFLPPPGTAREERVARLEEELARRGLLIGLTIKSRADDVDAALFRRLKRMGLLRVYLGIESGCQASLDLLGKGVTVQQNLQALITLDRLGIVADFYSLLFHPWSTLDMVEAEFAFLQRTVPYLSTPFRFNEVGIYPGTRLAERLCAERRRGGDGWPIFYEIADERVELLRRLNRFVFGASGTRARADRMAMGPWYILLLQRRFGSAQFNGGTARALRNTAVQLNRELLEVWGEMVRFARQDGIRDASRVNDRASAWAARANAASVRAEEELAELKLPCGPGAERTSAVPC